MNEAARLIAIERRALVARSGLCRLQLRRRAADMRAAFLFKRTAAGVRRTTRLVALAAELLFISKVAVQLLVKLR